MDFPLPHRPDVPPDAGHLRRLRERPLVPVVAAGREALLVTRHADVRTVLSDARFSREAWHGGTLFARTRASLALAAAVLSAGLLVAAARPGWWTAVAAAPLAVPALAARSFARGRTRWPRPAAVLYPPLAFASHLALGLAR
ncbi:hypothetical protein [Actinomadura sp. GTD37]|uniref:hypothetical protein n=1 Tax=Actinomadura sp. GTD37 TaxID=1778030 RepID=UPI0035C0B7FC